MDEEDNHEVIATLSYGLVGAAVQLGKMNKLEAVDLMMIMSNALWTIALMHSEPDKLETNAEIASEIFSSGRKHFLQKGAELLFDMKSKTGPVGHA